MADKAKNKALSHFEKNETAFLKKMITIHLKGKISTSVLAEKIDALGLTVEEKKKLNLVDIRLQKQDIAGLKLLYKKFGISISTMEQRIISLQFKMSNELKVNFAPITFDNLIKYLQITKELSKINGWEFGVGSKNSLENQEYKYVNAICSGASVYKGVA